MLALNRPPFPYLKFFRMLANAETANKIKIAPDSVLTILSDRSVKRALKKEMLPLKANHQLDEPRTTPATNAIAETKSRLELKRPTPANTAAKDRMVRGFVRVKNTVET